MQKRAIPKADQSVHASVEAATVSRLWCEVCGTDEFLLIEKARWRRRLGEGSWDIDYTCTSCDTFYGHVVKDSDVAPSLFAAMAAVGGDPTTNLAYDS